MPKGGAREGAGRKAGVPNKATADIRAAAQEYGAEAVEKMVSLMRLSDNDTVQLAAARDILDRAYGKARQALDVEANVHAAVTEIRRTIVSP